MDGMGWSNGRDGDSAQVSQSVIQSIGQLLSDWRAMAGRPEEEGMVVAWQQGSDWSEDVTDVWTLSRAYRIFAIGRRCNVL